jgi:hypothetical protein
MLWAIFYPGHVPDGCHTIFTRSEDLMRVKHSSDGYIDASGDVEDDV